MNVWLTLFKKEYRATRTSLFVVLGALVIIGFWLMYLSQQHNVPIIVAPVALLLTVATFHPPIFMLYSVAEELRHTPNLWLHCPQPAKMLLSAKLVMSLIMMITLLLVDTVFVYWALFSLNYPLPAHIDKQTLVMFVTEIGAYVALATIAISIYMSSWATLIAVATATARNILGRLKWLAGVAIFIISTWGMGKLQETLLFHKLTEWGMFTIPIQTISELVPAEAAFSGIPIYAGKIIFAIIVTVAVFALSAWLLDNKVEV